jgi:hypothetical protein
MSGEIHVAIQFMRLEGHFSFQVLSAVPNRHDAFLSSLTITFAPSTDSNGLFGALTARAGGLISSCVLHCVLHCIFAFTHVTESTMMDLISSVTLVALLNLQLLLGLLR